MLIAPAFLFGRFWPHAKVAQPESNASAATLRADVRNRILTASLIEHLDRSQMALTDLFHTAGNKRIDISSSQKRTHELLAENRLCQQSMMKMGDAGMAAILDDLEGIFLEVSNSSSTISSKELEAMQDRLESQGIILKLRIVGLNLQQKKIYAARKLAGQVPCRNDVEIHKQKWALRFPVKSKGIQTEIKRCENETNK